MRDADIEDFLAGTSVSFPLQAKMLPLEAALLLQRAAQIPITSADPLARVKAIEKAAARVRRDYPKFFKE